jgi:hypothetical protein
MVPFTTEMMEKQLSSPQLQEFIRLAYLSVWITYILQLYHDFHIFAWRGFHSSLYPPNSLIYGGRSMWGSALTSFGPTEIFLT